MTDREKLWIDRVVNLGCIVPGCWRPACFHHTGIQKTLGRKNHYRLGLGLCPTHHQNGGHGVAIHAGKQTFEKNFGTEISLLRKTYQRLGEPWPPTELLELNIPSLDPGAV